ncbi:hypothetical protein TNCV_503081 [Trichonephila clavipes]|nr:hypothetical protein TNCV_503081 [Trichonephila clavipes]
MGGFVLPIFVIQFLIVSSPNSKRIGLQMSHLIRNVLFLKLAFGLEIEKESFPDSQYAFFFSMCSLVIHFSSPVITWSKKDFILFLCKQRCTYDDLCNPSNSCVMYNSHLEYFHTNLVVFPIPEHM